MVEFVFKRLFVFFFTFSFDSLEIGKAKSYKEMELEHKTLLGLNKLGLL